MTPQHARGAHNFDDQLERNRFREAVQSCAVQCNIRRLDPHHHGAGRDVIDAQLEGADSGRLA